jgi:hypothetical protein
MLLVVAGCGTAAGKTTTGAGSGSGRFDASAPTAQSVPDFYGLTGDDSVVQYADGSWTTLKAELPAGEKLSQISWSHSPDARPLVTTKPTSGLGGSDCNPDIHWMTAKGQLSATIARGVSPSLSPDGQQLAYLVAGSASPPPAADAPVGVAECGGQKLVVEDLKTGTTESWNASYPAAAPNYMYGYVEGVLAWAPDSKHLVYATQEAKLYSLDTSSWQSGATVRDAHELQSPGNAIVLPMWNEQNGHLFIIVPNGDGLGPSLKQIDPQSGTTIKAIASSMSAMPFYIYGTSDTGLVADARAALRISTLDLGNGHGTLVATGGPMTVTVLL